MFIETLQLPGPVVVVIIAWIQSLLWDLEFLVPLVRCFLFLSDCNLQPVSFPVSFVSFGPSPTRCYPCFFEYSPWLSSIPVIFHPPLLCTASRSSRRTGRGPYGAHAALCWINATAERKFSRSATSRYIFMALCPSQLNFVDGSAFADTFDAQHSLSSMRVFSWS